MNQLQLTHPRESVKMDTTNRARFKTVYRESLREAVEKYPENYAWHYSGPLDVEVERVANRMFDAIERGSFGHDSKAFKITARKLGIKPTRAALVAYWQS